VNETHKLQTIISSSQIPSISSPRTGHPSTPVPKISQPGNLSATRRQDPLLPTTPNLTFHRARALSRITQPPLHQNKDGGRLISRGT
jgi:hypothetical protein